MKINKLLSLMVAGMLIATSLAPAAYADPGNNSNNKNKSIFSNSRFKDIDDDDVKWAKNSIIRMTDKGFLKGYGNGFFQPNKPVTQLEAIIMALRVAGEEPKAISYADLISLGKKNFKFKNLISLWAEGYVDLALEEDILDEDDVRNLNSSAKRYEVAKYMVRAIGLEDDAQDNMDADLDFEDDENVPDGYEGYVYVAIDRGIMTVYPNGMFLPNKPVTRAEMSIIMDRIDGHGDYDTDYEKFTGEVVSIDRQDREITLEIRGNDRTFDLASTVYVMFDDTRGSLSDIEVGDDVKITVNDDDKVIRIDVDRDLEDVDTYNGRVLAIDEDDVRLLIGGSERTFDVDADVDVVFDDRDGDVDDIIKGDWVKIYVDSDDDVIKVELTRDIEDFDTYDGEVTYVDSDEITIQDGSTERNFDFDGDVQVFFDDDEMGDVDDIDDGDDVELIVNEDDDVVTVIVDKEL
ncbi:S-layer domain protein [Peptoclostridium acidaminophilum DSM 3953]|uniref:S-layer domain protein n=1 Tax=Peptoclostridium acidaminophilum DSM 3953 TaxID=1286171 RepID=W8TDW9_PEPAC|nr:S-layer homology domain-containing protein [Peptoclostridium acidaminophilum]AHM56018.1 S-layer domain protein [Peptoclostridium acidaminophilum DSM 3953]